MQITYWLLTEHCKIIQSENSYCLAIKDLLISLKQNYYHNYIYLLHSSEKLGEWNIPTSKHSGGRMSKTRSLSQLPPSECFGPLPDRVQSRSSTPARSETWNVPRKSCGVFPFIIKQTLDQNHQLHFTIAWIVSLLNNTSQQLSYS